MLPLEVDREIVGSLGIATFRRHREFPPDFLSRLELVASVFASALYRTRAEARLREAQDLNRAVLASITSAIAVLDRDGRVAAVNEAWAAAAARVELPAARAAMGEDYLEACRSGTARGPSLARASGRRPGRAVRRVRTPRDDPSVPLRGR